MHVCGRSSQRPRWWGWGKGGDAEVPTGVRWAAPLAGGNVPPPSELCCSHSWVSAFPQPQQHLLKSLTPQGRLTSWGRALSDGRS